MKFFKLIILPFFLLVSCGKKVPANNVNSSSTTYSTSSLISISISEKNIDLKIGESKSLSVSFNPSNKYETVRWSSSNNSVAKVSSGLVLGQAAGQATITAATNSGKSASCIVSVTPEDSSISLNENNLEIAINETKKLSVSYEPGSNIDKSVVWESSDNTIASVQNGYVKGLKIGTTTVKATNKSGNFASCVINVVIPVTSISLNTNLLSMVVGETYSFGTTFEPANATNKTLTWSSSNPSIVSVEASYIEALSNGTSVITATSSNGHTSSCTVNVTTPVQSISLNKSNLDLKINTYEQLSVVFNPETSTDLNIQWTSSNNSIASVSNGRVYGASKGSATITATTTNGKFASCLVEVYKPIEYFWLYETDIEIEAGKTKTLSCFISPDDASNKTISWESSNPNIVTVTDGTIYGVGAGRATITASTVYGQTSTCQILVRVLPTQIILNEKNLWLLVGETFQLTATVLPENAENKTVSWISCDSSASVDENGLVTARYAGSTFITAYTANGVQANCTVHVTIPATSASLNPTYLLMPVGQTHTFSVSTTPSSNAEYLYLKTNNPDLIEFTSNRTIVAKAPGSAIVYVETSTGFRCETPVHIIEFDKVEDFTLKNYSSDGKTLTETASISDVVLNIRKTTTNSNSQYFDYSLTAYKTYCFVSGSYAFKLNYKIYSPNNVVVANGTITTPSFSVGETTIKSGSASINLPVSNPGGIYRIEFREVWW